MADKTRFEFGKDLVGVRIKGVGNDFYTGLDPNSYYPVIRLVGGQGDVDMPIVGRPDLQSFTIDTWGSTTPIRTLNVPSGAIPFIFTNVGYYGNTFAFFKGRTSRLGMLTLSNGGGFPTISVDLSNATGLYDLALVFEAFGPVGTSYSTVNLSGCTNLGNFYAGQNPGSAVGITSLNMSGCTGFTNFPCDQGAVTATSANFNGCTSLAYVTIYGTTSVVFTGCPLYSVNMAGCSLDQAGVDHVLAVAVAGGRNGGGLDLSGSNAEPSAAGWANVAILQSEGRGVWGVTVNGTPPSAPELIVNGTFTGGLIGWNTEQLSDGWGPQSSGYFGEEAELIVPARRAP